MTGASGGGNGVIIDASALFQKIAALQRGARPEPHLHAIGKRIMKWIDDNFENPIEHHWPPLKPRTLAARRGGAAGARPLQDTGRLKMAWTRASGNPHVFGDTVWVTNNVKYAKFHEFGTKRIPKRQMTPSEATARRLAISTMQAALDRVTAAAQQKGK